MTQNMNAISVADVGVGAELEQDCAGKTKAAEFGQVQVDPADADIASPPPVLVGFYVRATSVGLSMALDRAHAHCLHTCGGTTQPLPS